MTTVFFYLLISVSLNGESWEAVPAKFDTQTECEDYAKQYTGITNKPPVCFPANALTMRAAGLTP
jgi:hypothetical protein